MENYDAIVIGSGMGGLSTAALLAHHGRRVLVLERHFKLGGFNHEFMRGGYRWDVGLHYVGELEPGTRTRAFMDQVTGGRVEWTPLPSPFDVFHYPGLTFAKPAGRQAYLDELDEHFSGQRHSLRRYLDDVGHTAAWVARRMTAGSTPLLVRAGLAAANMRGRVSALATTRDELASRFSDPTLRGLLASEWGDYCLPPGQSAFAMHALIANHYLEGAHYPVGGSDHMVEAMVQVVRDAGGDCLVDHEVAEILLEKGAAIGVQAMAKKGGRHEVEFRAPAVISGAGAHATLGMVPDGALPKLRKALSWMRSGPGSLVVYLGLCDSPASLGLHGENHWIFSGFDHDAAYESTRRDWTKPTTLYFSTPSLKDPEASRHTAEIAATVPGDAFDDWVGTAWQRRGEDYLALKRRVADHMIDSVEAQIPGLRKLIDRIEVSTPLTVRHFANKPSGGFADLAGTPQFFRDGMVRTRSEIPGLLFTGADTTSLGIVGGLMSGVFTAGSVLGPTGLVRLMTNAQRSM